ncbi:MAG: hypothetical protein LUE27_10205 [Clostridia bacterium]|nr:hypothetical protein [Clostridia bacterium]
MPALKGIKGSMETENEKGISLKYGLYQILRQSGEDFEHELRLDFPDYYKEMIAVAMIDLAEDNPDFDMYQELYRNSVISLWYPGLDLGEERIGKIIGAVDRSGGRKKLLDFMRAAMDFASNVLTGDPEDPNIYDLKQTYNILRRDPYHSWWSLFMEFLSTAYLRRLMDDVLYVAREEYDDEELEDVDIKEFMTEAHSVSLICTSSSISITPVPERLQKFLASEECQFSLSPAAAFARN